MKPKRSAKSMSPEQLYEATECLKAMAHPHRLQMLQMVNSGQHTVGELAAACGIASPVASNHLRLMERVGLLHSRRDGKNIYYQISDPQISPIIACIENRFG